MNRATGYEAVLVAVLLALSLVLRTADLGVFIASDELRWTCRSLLFRDAVTRGAWSDTYRVGHPGVVTMWLGALTLPASESAVETCLRSEEVEHISQTAETPEEQTQRLAELGRLLPSGRLGVGVFTWLCLVAVWALARSAIGPGVALVGLAALGLDPFLLAHSRFLHLDAVTAMLSLAALVALLAALAARTEPRRRMALVVSGAAAGLAMLEKSPALFLGPFAALSLGVVAVVPIAASRRLAQAPVRSSQFAIDLIVWGGAAGVIYVIGWPAMWVEPLSTLQGVLAKASGYAVGGHDPGNFFLGRISDDPGPLFYPVALAFRLTPVALVGLAAVVYSFVWRSWRGAAALTGARKRRAALLLLTFALTFLTFMTAGAKKFDRYVLPTIVALDLTAAVGLVWLVRAITVRCRRFRDHCATFLTAAVTGIVLLVMAVAHHPYYLTVYNPLLGGAPVAQRAILVGWGEGYGLAAGYLNAQPSASDAQAATRGVSNLMPLFAGRTRSMSSYRPWESDYVVLYISHVQRRHDPEVLERYLLNPDREPEYVVRLAGIDYVWIYRNDSWRAPLDAILGSARAGDALMTNGTSLIREHYTGDLPELYVYGHWAGPETDELLAEVPSDVSRIWYARYTEADPRPIQQTLHRRAMLERYESFPDVELYLYRLVRSAPDALNASVAYGDSPEDAVLELTGAGVAGDTLRWAQDNLVQLGWQLAEPTDADYHVQLRLTGSDGYVWAAAEEPILNAQLAPTSAWIPAEPVIDGYRLSPPAGLPPGEYWLEVDVGRSLAAGGSEVQPTQEAPPLEPVASTADVRIPVQVGEPAARLTSDDVVTPDIQRLEVQLDQMSLVGVELGVEPATAGETLPVGLIWEMDATATGESQLELRLAGLNGVQWGSWRGSLRTSDQPWARSGHNLALDPAAGGVARLVASLNGGAETPINLVPVVAPQPHFQPPAAMQHRVDYRLGGDGPQQSAVGLLGFDVSEPVVAPGDSVGVTLYWQAGGPIAPAQKVFVHLLGSDGQLYGQKDNAPVVDRRPTTSWESGEVLADPYVLNVDATAPAGEYVVTVGMYDPETADRLAAFDADDNRLPDDRIVLETIEVK